MVWLVSRGSGLRSGSLGRLGCAPGASALPLGVGLDDGQVDQLGRGLLVGEVPAGLDRLADLAVQPLDRVGRVDRAAQLLGQREKRNDVLPCVAPRSDVVWVAPAPFCVEALELD